MSIWISILLLAADWLNQGLRVQPNERELSPATARKMKRLWTRQLTDGPLSAPVILGRLITYRGTVELVFVASAAKVFAIDGDFGKTFWERDLGSSGPCAVPATPALSPDAPGHDEDDDGPQPLRPIYVIGPSAKLYSLHPIDGKDLAPPRVFHCAAFLSVQEGKAVGTAKASVHPISANGLRFEVTDALRVFDVKTNTTLYQSEPVVNAGALALANGHVCFSTSNGALSCYGIPMEQ